jgi:hypothetical protein
LEPPASKNFVPVPVMPPTPALFVTAPKKTAVEPAETRSSAPALLVIGD